MLVYINDTMHTHIFVLEATNVDDDDDDDAYAEQAQPINC